MTRPNGYNKCCGTRQQPPVARGARAIPKRHGRSCEMNAHTSASKTLGGEAHANSTLALQELADGGALVALGLRQSSARPRRVEAHLQQPPELGFLGISACKKQLRTVVTKRYRFGLDMLTWGRYWEVWLCLKKLV